MENSSLSPHAWALVRRVAIALIVIDAIFILAFLFFSTLSVLGIIERVPIKMDLAHDHSISERFGYFKWGLIVVLLGWCFAKTREWLKAALAVGFLLLLADDALRLHERIGRFFANRFDLSLVPFLRDQDVGEYLSFAIIGLVMAVLLAVGMYQASAADRQIGRQYILLLLALILVGGFLDLVLVTLRLTLAATIATSLLLMVVEAAEDGGEMVVSSLTLGFTFGVGHDTIYPVPKSSP